MKEESIIVLTFITFSVIHSITASIIFKDKIKSVFGLRFYDGWFRILYNLFSMVFLLPILFLATALSPIVWHVTNLMILVFNGVRLLAIIGIGISFMQIDWRSFLGIRQVIDFWANKTSTSVNELLVTKGLYRTTRHPLYFFSLIFIWFNPVMTRSWLIFSIVASLYFFIGSYFEERKLVKQYGDQYREYRKAVPWLIPFLKMNRTQT